MLRRSQPARAPVVTPHSRAHIARSSGAYFLVRFQLVSESNVLRNPVDDHSLNVFKPEIRSHTDQFLLVFKKPT